MTFLHSISTDPLNAFEDEPAPSKKLRHSLMLYVLGFGVISALLYVANLTTLVLALTGIITFAAGYWQGWRDGERPTGG